MTPARLLVVLALSGCSRVVTPDEPATPESGVVVDPAGEGLCRVEATCWGSILDEPKAPCSVTVTDPSGLVQYDGPAGFELRGRSSLTFDKSQYAVELRAATELPLWPGSSWRYLDDGSDPGTLWRSPGFDDGAWKLGHAPLGFGDAHLATTVRSGDGPSVTTYARTSFVVQARAAVTKVQLGLMRDDGAALYLNGVEVARDNLPAGALYDTPATTEVSDLEGSTWREVEVDPALLVDGENLLAVELHRISSDDPDLRFDLYVEATGDDVDVDLLGMGADADWILNGQYVDRVLFRNRLMYDVFQSLGGKDRYATETRFCTLSLDGEELGIYTLGEKLERGDDRLDLGSADLPGDSFLVEIDDREGFLENRVGQGFWKLEYPDDGDPEEEAAVAAHLQGFEEAVLGPDAADPDLGMFAWLDLDSAVDWVLVQELARNHDAYRLSVELWRDEGGRMYFAPWDFDLSMGYPATDCGAEGWVGRTYLQDGVSVDLPFVQVMATVPAFRERLVERWRELRVELLTRDVLEGRLAGYDATLAPALDANAARWPIGDIRFPTDANYGPDLLCPVDDYADEHARTLDFLWARLTWMDTWIDQF